MSRRLIFALALLLPLFRLGSAQSATTLKVMTFNVWHGGAQVDFQGVVEAIRKADADVVGVQEPEGNLRRIAGALGWSHADESLHLISRVPIYPAERDGLHFGFVEVETGKVVAVANFHLTSSPYGPEAVRDGASVGEVLALERTVRLPQIEPTLKPLSELAAAGVPVFIVGDLNSPSHLDWTREVAAVRSQVRYPLEWPVTKALANAGFRDSYRDVHPDAVKRPGLTWTPGTPPPFIPPKETLDRIDVVMASGPAAAIASELVGETGGPDVDIGIDRWPSDHRAVVSTFRVTPLPAGPMVAVERRVVRIGEPIVIRYISSGAVEGARIALLPSAGSDEPTVSLSIYDGTDYRAVSFGTVAIAAGEYRAALTAGDGSILASTPVWVLARDAVPMVKVGSESYPAGAPIAVRWENAPGNKFDWVGIYEVGERDLRNNARSYLYTGALPEGEVVFDVSVLKGPLNPGDYVAGIFADDGYLLLAKAPFRIVPR